MNRTVSLIILTLFFYTSYAQDTLPNFTVVERGNKVTISWYNPYSSIVQLNVQRSFDSARNFTTVFSPISPQLPQNGYTETKPPTNQVYYRIFYVQQGGAYFFTKSRRVGSDPRRDQAAAAVLRGDAKGFITVNLRDSFYSKIPFTRFRHFRDSILNYTKDTLTPVNDSLLVIARYTGPENFRPSFYIYSNRYGIAITLPNAPARKYRVKFFEENGTPLFEIPNVKEPHLILDKSNFFHAGWFLFELYEDERLKEKNRFYLSKDF